MKFIILILSFLVLGYASIDGKSTSLPTAHELSQLDSLRLQELARIRAAVGDEVWPGYGRAELGMILVGNRNQWALNIEQIPYYYHTVAVPESLKGSVRVMGETQSFHNWRGELLSVAPTELYRAFSKEQTGDHFKQSVFFVRTLDAYNNSGDPMPTEVWMHISLHELFHVFQDQYVDYTPELMSAVEVPFKEKIRTDSEHDRLLAPEQKLLAAAACAADITKVQEGVKAAMKLRSKRWSYIKNKYGAKPDQWERYDAWAEGTAYYVEHQMMSRWPE